ncbi:hypothetical protein L7F22_066817 [Adiantum nelumboides]|nr:hypothetical protein [Adiantum nelumboides]
MATNCELYRKASIGTSLNDALDELVTNGSLPPLLAVKVLMQFDKSMNDALQTKIKSKVTFKVMQNARFLAFLQPPFPTQQVGSQAQMPEPVRAQTQVMHTANLVETPVRLSEPM